MISTMYNCQACVAYGVINKPNKVTVCPEYIDEYSSVVNMLTEYAIAALKVFKMPKRTGSVEPNRDVAH